MIGRSVWLAAAVAVTAPAPAQTQQEAAGLDAETLRGFAFRGIGPSLTTGRIADVEIDPNDPSVWYVAAASGGLWKTVNRGNTWTPIFDEYGSYSLGVVTVDPRDSNIVWLGTGENQSQRAVSFGDGIYKSVDAGETWTHVGLDESEHIQRILIDPRNSNVVYVAAQGPLWAPGGHRGVYKTVDGGETWSRVLHVSDDTGITDLVMDPVDPDVFYAAAYQRRRRVGQLIGGGPEAGVFKSTDAGATWRRIENGLPAVHKGRIALAVDPRNRRRVYAQVVAQGEEGGFFRSDDGGESWSRMSDHNGGDPQYYGELFVDPHQPETIWTIEVRVHRSQDGGRTFEAMDFPIHVDQHEIVFDPDDPDHMLIGNDGGLYETYDAGETWRHFTNLPLSQFYRIAVDDARPFYNVCGGAQDNGTICGPARSLNSVGVRTSDWIRVGGGDGFQPRVEPGGPGIVYTLSQNGALSRLDLTTGRSTGIRPGRPEDGDGRGGRGGGGRGGAGGEGVEEDEPRFDPDADRWNWDSPLLISPHSPGRLYFAGSKLYRSDDRGDAWTPVSGDLTRQLDRDTIPIMGRLWPEDAVSRNLYTTALSTITALDESPLVEGLLYVGTDDGLIQISEDGGASWRRVDGIPGLPDLSYVTDLLASPAVADVVFATFNNWQRGDFEPYVFKSTDRGRSWTSITGNLPSRSGAWSIVQDIETPDLMFVGLEFGVWFTVDGGSSWTQLRGGIPTIQARDLAIQPRETDLVVGTFGRGAYILDDYTALREMNAGTLAAEAKLFPLRDAYLFDPLPQARAAWGNVAMPNTAFGALLTYHVRAAPADGDTLVLTIQDATGGHVRRMALPRTAGLHRVAWDLRADPPEPPPDEGRGRGAQGGRGGRDGQQQGPVVAPGRYSAQLGVLESGAVTPLADPRTFNVVRLDAERGM